MTHPRAAAVLMLAFVALVALNTRPAQALTQYHCVVENFIGFNDDTIFKANNKRKTFTLLVKRDEVIAFVKSREFRDYENTYRITRRGLLNIFAIGDQKSSLNTLAMPAKPRNSLNHKGYFKATIATQANHYLNTWLLRCTD
ncbi:hypothetical protein N4R57_13280 [Rhodobacteraceae bacterium D3-12]|nr:hypothetical protein N4R57_13280 [Rhodobacteraceae bacterium D3-12]